MDSKFSITIRGAGIFILTFYFELRLQNCQWLTAEFCVRKRIIITMRTVLTLAFCRASTGKLKTRREMFKNCLPSRLSSIALFLLTLKRRNVNA